MKTGGTVLMVALAVVAGWFVWGETGWSDGGRDPDLGGREGPVRSPLPTGPRPDDQPGVSNTGRFQEPDTPVVLSRAQKMFVERVQEVLGDQTPARLSMVQLEADAIERLATRVEVEFAAHLEIGRTFLDRARERAEEVFSAHGYREWEARRVRVPDPDAPDRFIDRLSTPYDGQRDDEFILAKGAPHPTRRLLHVVRLVPESDPKYARIHADRLKAESALRQRLSAWLLEQL